MKVFEAINQIKTGLADLAQLRRDYYESNLRFLARFEKRAAWQGNDWTWSDMIETSDEVEHQRSKNLSLKEVKRRCEVLLAKDTESKPNLLREIENGEADGMVERVRAMLDGGADPNMASLLKDTPLAYAHTFGRRDVFDLLIEKGADPDKIGFTPLHRAVRYGTIAEVAALLGSTDVLQKREDADSVLMEAVHQGSADVLDLVLSKVAEDGRMTSQEVTTCFHVAIEADNIPAVEAFLVRGIDPNDGLDATLVSFNTVILDLLLKAGADVHQISDVALYHEDPMSVIGQDGQPAMPAFIGVLLQAGWSSDDLDEFEEGQLRFITGVARLSGQDTSAADFATPSGVIRGDANPSEVTAPFHLEMLRTGETPYSARARIVDVQRPAWTMSRFGQSTNRLDDGTWVHIGGEHEDFYDPDFVIFSDVVTVDSNGTPRVLFYPASVFPPTDFHSATVLEDAIWIIGNTGYTTSRVVAHTPVFRLSLTDFSIHKVDTTGDAPGWISRHKAHESNGRITLSGGVIWDGSNFVDNDAAFILDVATSHWMRS